MLKIAFIWIMDFRKIIARIFEQLEEDNVEAATMACLRIARTSQDYLNAAIFLRELYPNGEDVGRMIYTDTNHLKEEAGKFVFERSFDRWLELHTLDFPFPSDDTDNRRPSSPDSSDDNRMVLKVAAGEIEGELSQWQGTLQDLMPPAGLLPFDAAAFHDSATRQRAKIRLRVAAIQTIKSRLKARCLNYAIQIEKQLIAQDRNQAFLWAVENDVNNYFKDSNIDLYQKLQKASSLASSGDGEDAALLLTEVRRVLKAAADHFYPARDEPVMCSDGKERVLGDDRYLNRLNEYLASNIATSTARDLAKAELSLLDAFMRRLNDLASKGVHAEVSLGEARQGLVGTYMFLSTLTQQAYRTVPAG